MLAGIRIRETSDADGAGLDLELLADQLSTIAKELRQGGGHSGGNLIEVAASRSLHRRNEEPFRLAEEQQPRLPSAEIARQVYAKRRRRAALFGNDELFGEPAWDILLDLYIAHAENKAVSVSSACIGSASPPTTGLRWLGVLAENGLILREHDPEDQRRVLVRLTDRGIAAMDEYFG